jgi:hypothetical protein
LKDAEKDNDYDSSCDPEKNRFKGFGLFLWGWHGLFLGTTVF